MGKFSNRTLVFDFDGTLADSLALGLDLANDFLGDRGHEPLTEDQLEELRSMSVGQLLKRFRIPFYRLPGVVVEARKRMGEMIDDLEPVDGIVDMIEHLHKDSRKLGLVSTNSEENVRFFLEKYKLEKYFEFVDCGSGVFGKARRLKKVLARNNLDVANCLYIGDELRDVDAARKLKLDIVSVAWGLNSATKLEESNADLTVDTVQELVRLIK